MIDIFNGMEDSIGKLFDGVSFGSPEAKKIWAQINFDAHSPTAIAEAKTINAKATGMYMGKPLVPGEVGEGQGDWQFLHDKLVYSSGYSPEVADKICGKIASGLY